MPPRLAVLVCLVAVLCGAHHTVPLDHDGAIAARHGPTPAARAALFPALAPVAALHVAEALNGSTGLVLIYRPWQAGALAALAAVDRAPTRPSDVGPLCGGGPECEADDRAAPLLLTVDVSGGDLDATLAAEAPALLAVVEGRPVAQSPEPTPRDVARLAAAVSVDPVAEVPFQLRAQLAARETACVVVAPPSVLDGPVGAAVRRSFQAGVLAAAAEVLHAAVSLRPAPLEPIIAESVGPHPLFCGAAADPPGGRSLPLGGGAEVTLVLLRKAQHSFGSLSFAASEIRLCLGHPAFAAGNESHPQENVAAAVLDVAATAAELLRPPLALWRPSRSPAVAARPGTTVVLADAAAHRFLTEVPDPWAHGEPRCLAALRAAVSPAHASPGAPVRFKVVSPQVAQSTPALSAAAALLRHRHPADRCVVAVLRGALSRRSTGVRAKALRAAELRAGLTALLAEPSSLAALPLAVGVAPQRYAAADVTLAADGAFRLARSPGGGSTERPLNGVAAGVAACGPGPVLAVVQGDRVCGHGTLLRRSLAEIGGGSLSVVVETMVEPGGEEAGEDRTEERFSVPLRWVGPRAPRLSPATAAADLCDAALRRAVQRLTQRTPAVVLVGADRLVLYRGASLSPAALGAFLASHMERPRCDAADDSGVQMRLARMPPEGIRAAGTTEARREPFAGLRRGLRRG